MTKIWCTICHKSDFGVDRPTQRHVLGHIQDAHKRMEMINSVNDQERWRQHQSSEWEKRHRELRELLDASVGHEDGNEDEDLKQQWKKHMEGYDDGEFEEVDRINGPRFDINADGQGETTADEEATSDRR